MCKKIIARQWAIRLLYEATTYEGNNCFITLTYEDTYCDNLLHEDHFVKFMKRLRKHLEPSKIKFFGCGEYGETIGRPHYHIIIFGFLPKQLYIHHYNQEKPIWSSPELDKLWKYGFNQVGSVEKGSIYYVTGYILKKNGDQGFRRMSLGLGKDYALENKQTLINKYLEGYAIPRYLLDKLEIPMLVRQEIQEKLSEELSKDKRIKNNKFSSKERLMKNKREYRNQLVEAKDLLKQQDFF
jgi:hypothetical protein